MCVRASVCVCSDHAFLVHAGGPSSLRLCMFAWEVQTLAPQSQHSCVLGVFDMNRWYHAQMPVSIRSEWNAMTRFFYCLFALIHFGYKLESSLQTVSAVEMSSESCKCFYLVDTNVRHVMRLFVNKIWLHYKTELFY